LVVDDNADDANFFLEGDIEFELTDKVIFGVLLINCWWPA